jgi:hypothetical protein
MLGDHFKIRVLYEKVRLILVSILKEILAEMFKHIFYWVDLRLIFQLISVL